MASTAQHPLAQLLDAARWRLRTLEEIRSASWFTLSNYVNILFFVGFVAFAIYQTRSKMQESDRAATSQQYLPAEKYPEIESLNDFAWKKEDPLKIRELKPKYHLTMVDASALKKLNPSELILMDNTYEDRLSYRKKIMKEQHDIVVGINDEQCAAPAIRELYTWLVGTYLPKRYPSMFKLHKASFETGDSFMLENLITKEILPAQATKNSRTISLLESLGRTVDEDFLFLIPEDESEEIKDPKYILEAYVTICANGFNPREKLGRRLADIHGPVPGYSSILEGSMDRYFAKIQVGEYVKRSNWNITTNPELLTLPGEEGNHAHEGDDIQELDSIDVDKTFLRCERQTLHRLPQSEALVFAFKTYMYPIKDIKDEGLGEELAQAIDGMREGNVPAMHFYKRGVVWGEAVKKYLRS